MFKRKWYAEGDTITLTTKRYRFFFFKKMVETKWTVHFIGRDSSAIIQHPVTGQQKVLIGSVHEWPRSCGYPKNRTKE